MHYFSNVYYLLICTSYLYVQIYNNEPVYWTEPRSSKHLLLWNWSIHPKYIITIRRLVLLYYVFVFWFKTLRTVIIYIYLDKGHVWFKNTWIFCVAVFCIDIRLNKGCRSDVVGHEGRLETRMRIGIWDRASIVIVMITFIDALNRLFGYEINFWKKNWLVGRRNQMRILLETGHVVLTYFYIPGSWFHEGVVSLFYPIQ